jgi:hypothetical protein
MKISGPGQPAAPGADALGKDALTKNEGVGPSSKATDPKAVNPKAAEAKPSGSGKAFAEKMAPAGPVTPAKPANPTARTSRLDATRPAGKVAVGDLAAGLKTGKLDSRAVLDKLIERVIDAQLGSGAPPQLREQIQSALRDAIEADPLLASKLGQLDE